MNKGDLVILRRNKSDNCKSGKFLLTWVGPYVIDDQLRENLFKLRKLDGSLMSSVIHRDRLHRYYKHGVSVMSIIRG